MSAIDDDALARLLADEAGRALLALRGEGLTGAALGDAGDRIADDLILAGLARHRPHDPILSEESADDVSRLAGDRVWIVDPLDGTREYREGRDDWAVHVGLAVGGEARVGAVALPALGVTLATDAPAPAVARPARPRLVVSRTRPAPEALAVADALDGTLIAMGSAGAKAMAVVRGEADIYLHSGGQYQWDSCAPVAVARAAGLHVSRIDGAPIRYNAPDPYLPDLLICPPALAARVLAVLAR